jgi:hypothetical protein
MKEFFNKLLSKIKNFILGSIAKKMPFKTTKTYFFYRWLVMILQTKSDWFEPAFIFHNLMRNCPEEFNIFAENVIDCFVISNNLFVVTNRPGFIIGKGGETINKLEDVSSFKIKIIEDISMAKVMISHSMCM